MTRNDSAHKRALFEDASFFFSPNNAAATVDQRDLEAQALEALDAPAVRQAVEVATMRFDMLAGSNVPSEARSGTDQRMREWAFGHAAMAMNSDPNNPKVLGNVLGPPHEWFGRAVPGQRGIGTGENADCYYSIVPLDPYSRYELVGKVQDPPISDAPLYVAGGIAFVPNVAALDWRDIQIDDNGIFTITIDPHPSNGRPNHLQTTIDARFLFLRDCRRDWAERPNAYRIRRLDAPLGRALTRQDKVGLAARYIVEDVPMMWWFRIMLSSVETNTLTSPALAGPVGGMNTQALTRGRLELEDDEAYVLTITSGGARYWTIAGYDWWAMSSDFGARTRTLNNTQSKPNPDGTYTYVFAASDPGIHNWIDTGGRRHTMFSNRWQQLPRDSGAETPSANGHLVKLSKLPSVLPKGTPRITPEGRARQLADRANSFARRYAL